MTISGTGQFLRHGKLHCLSASFMSTAGFPVIYDIPGYPCKKRNQKEKQCVKVIFLGGIGPQMGFDLIKYELLIKIL